MKKPDRKFITITASFLLLCMSAVSAAGIGRGSKSKYQYTIPEGFELDKLDLEDGVYTGIATGFSPDLTVEVTVEKGKVTEIEIFSHNEIGPQYYSRPIKYVPGSIIEEQSTDLDAVSGATATSYGIMAAVENAVALDTD